MDSAGYLYNLTKNGSIVRRDLPISSPVGNLTPKSISAEFESLKNRALTSVLSHEFNVMMGPAAPQRPQLIASADGKIEAMLLTIPVDTTGEIATIFDALFSMLPSRTTLTCLVNTGSKKFVEGLANAAGRNATTTIIEAPDHVGFSVWAQDAYAVSKSDTGTTFFIEPLSFLRYADAVISDYVSTATALENFQTPLYFQGGNILVGDDFWLIGLDYPTKTLGYVQDAIFPNPGETPEALVRRLYTEYLDTGRTLHYVGATVPVPEEEIVLSQEGGEYFVDQVFQGNHGGTRQPLFHIDMFMTLAGRGDDGRYRILIGDPSIAPPAPGSSAIAYRMQGVFDNIAQRMTALGFNVIRNPLPLTYSSHLIDIEKFNQPQYPDLFAIYQRLKSAGLKEVTLRKFYFATANNALVQNDATEKTVWLPTYGHGSVYAYLVASDRRNSQIWQDMGYTVKLLPSFHALARGLGAVHCIQKFLARS